MIDFYEIFIGKFFLLFYFSLIFLLKCFQNMVNSANSYGS